MSVIIVHWLLWIFLMICLFPHAHGLIGSKKLTILPNVPQQIDTFAFESGGTFNISATAYLPGNSTPETILLMVQKGKKCEQIASHCTFDLLGMENLCGAYTVTNIFSKISTMFPVIVPHAAYFPTENTTTMEFNVSDWLRLEGTRSSYNVRSFINVFITPVIGQRIQPSFNSSEQEPNATTILESITSIASGDVRGTDHLSFMLLSCSNNSIE